MAKIDPVKMWSLNYRLIRSVLGSVASRIEDLGMEAKDLFLLAEIDDHSHPTALAAVLLMPKPSVTVAVRRLEAAGFVERAIDADDLRKHKLTLTSTGRKALARGLAILSKAFEERLARLTSAQQQELRTILERLDSEAAAGPSASGGQRGGR